MCFAWLICDCYNKWWSKGADLWVTHMTLAAHPRDDHANMPHTCNMTENMYKTDQIDHLTFYLTENNLNQSHTVPLLWLDVTRTLKNVLVPTLSLSGSWFYIMLSIFPWQVDICSAFFVIKMFLNPLMKSTKNVAIYFIYFTYRLGNFYSQQS